MDSRFTRRALLVLLAAALAAAASVVLVSPPARAGTAVVFLDDFESGALGPRWTSADNDPASGLDTWGVTNYSKHAENYSAWAAQVGNQSKGPFAGMNNSDVHEYDDDMEADLSIDLRVDGFSSLTLSFYYRSRAESGGGDFIQAWYETNGTQTVIFTNTGGTGNRWDLVSVAVPNDVERLIIRFTTDSANHGFEGAYVDDVVLTGTESNPPTSAVGALPTHTNAVPYPIPYTAQDGANESGVDYVELWYRMGASGPFSLYARPANPQGRWNPWLSPTIPFDTAFTGGDGTYEFYTVAVDNASNPEAAPTAADATMTIDTTPPALTITAPAGGGWLTAASVTVTWQGSDALSGLDRYETAIDGGALTSAGTGTSRVFSGLSEGPHDIAVRAYDGSGNLAIATVSFGVDTAAPMVAISAPGANAVFNANAVTFEWTGSDATSGIDHYEVWVDGESPTTTTDANVTVGAIADGTHTFHVAAVDRAGNRAEASVAFTVNLNPYGWALWLLLILALAAILFLVLWWKRRKDERELEERVGTQPALETGADEPPAIEPIGEEGAGEPPRTY